MATISNEGSTSIDKFTAEIGAMSDDVLVAQSLVQQGAVNVIGFLLKHGCTEALATDVLASLRTNARLIREEAVKRGKPNLFADDQTGFS